MKKLAIIPNPTKGTEIIQALKELGGENNRHLIGDAHDDGINYYSIDNINSIDLVEANDKSYCIMDIDTYKEEYPYNIGDTILIDVLEDKIEGTIVKKEWYEDEVIYYINNNDFYFQHQIIGKTHKDENKPILDLNWSQAEIDTYFNTKSVKDAKNVLKIEDYLQKHNLTLPTQIIINNLNGITLEDFQKTCHAYPNDINACYEIMNVDCYNNRCIGYKEDLICAFQDLLICYDAYCKVLGNYKPNWLDNCDAKFCIGCVGGKVTTFETYTFNYILTFPNERVRDIFLKNFTTLIETCKNLL
jgi:hypothetical protein